MATTTTAAELTSQQALLLYDGQCGLCQRSVRILKQLDWLGKLAYQDGRDVERLPATQPPLVPQRLLEEMHLLTPKGRVHAGFHAFRWMAWRLPLLVPIAPFLYLPGMPWLGNKVYLWVARNRFKLVPCHAGQCQLPPARGTTSVGNETTGRV